jgi:CheY-like chemotaxis protein
MKLLIVDDSEAIRRMIKSVLADLADEIYECSDGGEALPLYSRHLPDWVLMDIKMNPVNGITATGQIKELFPDAKIVIVTNYDDAQLRGAAYRAGACHYVLKRRLFDIQQILIASEPPSR